MENFKTSQILDLLIKEYDGSTWSEDYLFSLSGKEGDKVDKFIKEYNKDGHLDLLREY